MAEKSADIVRFLLLQLREYHLELLAQRAVIANFKEIAPQVDVDALFKFYKNSERFQEEVERFYAQSDLLIDKAIESNLDQAFSEWLDHWKFSGPGE